MFTNDTSVRDLLMELLIASGVDYRHLVHEPSLTSEDSARIRGTLLSAGVKSLILRGRKSGNLYQFNLPSDLKLEPATIRDKSGEKCEFVSAEFLYDKWRLFPGAVPPFGRLLGCRAFYDERILNNPEVAFNCGLRTESIIMKAHCLWQLVRTEAP